MSTITQPAAAVPQDSSPRLTRILVVEDNDLARKQLQQLLQANASFQVDGVANGQKALAALEEHGHSLVLTDLRMPGFDGLDLVRMVQQRRLPVTMIVMTAFGS